MRGSIAVLLPAAPMVLLLFVAGPDARAEAGAAPESTYHVDAVIDGAIIVAGAAGTLVPYLLSPRLIAPTCPCRRDSVNAFDRGVIGNSSRAADWISTLTVAVSAIAPPVADWLALSNTRTLIEDLTVFAEAVAVNGALVTAAKYSFQRPIPQVYSDPALATSADNYRSFYSGHTSLAFTVLTVGSVTVDRRYGLTWQPWVVTALVGGSVAWERILAGKHFYSDVMVGAAMGLTVGGGVSWAHLRERRVHATVSPPPSGTGAILGLGGPL